MNQLPLTDQTGRTIDNQTSWNFARNQQRNWETIMQMISLRAQPMIVKYSKKVGNYWELTFEVETPAVYSINGDVNNYDMLLNECQGIPMITGLGEKKHTPPHLVSQGEHQNIWFETVNN